MATTPLVSQASNHEDEFTPVTRRAAATHTQIASHFGDEFQWIALSVGTSGA